MNRLKELREYNNLSKSELSRKSGVARSVINFIEGGERKMNVTHAEKFSKVFGNSPYYIIGTDAVKFGDTRVDDLYSVIKSILDAMSSRRGKIEYSDEELRRIRLCNMILDRQISIEDLGKVFNFMEKLVEDNK